MKDNHDDNPDAFLLTDTSIMTGQGRAIVCAVGENTLLARIRSKEDLEIEETNTHLEEKLKFTAKQIEKFAMMVAVGTVITHLLFEVIFIPATD